MKKKELLKIIKKNGFSLCRQGGDHEIYKRGDMEIQVPRHAEIKEGLAKSIIKQSKR